MEEIVKSNKAKSWLFEQINKLTKLQPDSSRNKARKIKSTKLEMKNHNRQHRNTKDHKRLLSATI